MSLIEDVRAGRARLDTSPRALRKAALGVGAIVLAVAGWLLFRQRAPDVRLGLGAAGALLMLAGTLFAARLRTAYLGWMTVALAIGFRTAALIL